MGAFVLFFKIQSQGGQVIGVIGFLQPSWLKTGWGRLLEALIFSIIGGFLGTIITGPVSESQALVAGLGWTGLLSKAGTGP